MNLLNQAEKEKPQSKRKTDSGSAIRDLLPVLIGEIMMVSHNIQGGSG